MILLYLFELSRQFLASSEIGGIEGRADYMFVLLLKTYYISWKKSGDFVYYVFINVYKML